jgi:predicted Fe-S protein YdhL (DUF1289 family)
LIASPCNKVCVMDAEQRYCLGCWRTLAEIAAWGSMTDEEQRVLLLRLEQRRNISRTKMPE